MRITGNESIRIAERDGLTIRCHANPVDGGGIVSAEEARRIAKEDPGLLWVEVSPVGWVNAAGHPCDPEGRTVAPYFGRNGEYLGPDADGIEPRWQDGDDEWDRKVTAPAPAPAPTEYCLLCFGSMEIPAFSWESKTGYKQCPECKGTGYGSC